jgi:hypothetical protein
VSFTLDVQQYIAPPTNLIYAQHTPSYVQGFPIASNTVTSVTGAVTGYTAAALPPGLSINPTTGEITGTPTSVAAATDYPIRAYNSAGETFRILTITVTAPTPAAISFNVGASSPTPPNPDPYGTSNNDVVHTYTLRNTGQAASSAITTSITGTNPARWTKGTDGCNGNTLEGGASCTIQVTFTAGVNGTNAGSYSANIRATATTGGTVTNAMTGTAAYTANGSACSPRGSSVPGAPYIYDHSERREWYNCVASTGQCPSTGYWYCTDGKYFEGNNSAMPNTCNTDPNILFPSPTCFLNTVFTPIGNTIYVPQPAGSCDVIQTPTNYTCQ